MDLAHVKTLWRGSALIWDMPGHFGVVELILEPVHIFWRGLELIWDKFGYIGEDSN